MSDPTATRSRILDTAAALFYERGVHAVGVQEIVRRANASKLSLYRYFPSKEDLVREMLAEHSDRIHAWLRRKTADAPPGPQRVLSVFDLLIGWFAEPGYGGCTVLNTVSDTRMDPEITAIARRHLTRYRALLEERLREIGAGDPEGLARQLLLLIEGASVVTSIEGSPGPGADARAAAARLIGA
ncbi:TetR/AcrR family transcriptional regulator [Amycolatopsis rhizosphaerae]|uniref:TetR/AcrR family transcriptional regulator n=1 Tax=Amycolatopsis rhizosphaerae TaxID=2053003 RepID=A0A558APG6_9PSEU|nr:TetR/AcrR family transcriptional regulator [Amycolatopsis rhizosphaerae]TVT26148.1 TetR/AcrR family transcriptional regulator [Amycolatopsis rhizosphaerae]